MAIVIRRALWEAIVVAAVALQLLAPLGVSGVHAETPNAHEIVFSILAILVGGVLCFFGYRLFKWVVLLVGFVIAGGATFVLLSRFTHLNVWINVGISCAVGVGGGLLLFWLFWVSVFCLGALGGAIIAIYVQSMRTGGLIHSEAGKWSFIGGGALVGGVITLIFQKLLIILLTSFGGAFSVAIAVDTFAGGELTDQFSESFRNDEDTPSEWPQLSTMSKIFLGMAGLLFIAGVLVQYLLTSRNFNHRTGKKEEEQGSPEEKKTLLNRNGPGLMRKPV